MQPSSVRVTLYQGAAFALELERQEESKRVTAAAPSAPSAAAAAASLSSASAPDEPPKKKIFISLKRSGSNGSDA